MLRVERNGNIFEIKAVAIAYSYQMTCLVVRVAKLGDGEVEAEQSVDDEDAKGWWWGTIV